MPLDTVLLIDRGDLPSLVAAALEPDGSRLVLWHPVEPDPAEPRRLAAVREHGEAFGTRSLVISALPDLGVPEMAPPPALYQAHMLLSAAVAAMQLDCSRVIWPVQVGPAFEQVGELMNRAHAVANLTTNLTASGPRGPRVAIDLPLVDLSDRQLIDLLQDSGAPTASFWPCHQGQNEPCHACHGCKRWQTAFSTAGTVPWPWERLAVAQ